MRKLSNYEIQRAAVDIIETGTQQPLEAHLSAEDASHTRIKVRAESDVVLPNDQVQAHIDKLTRLNPIRKIVVVNA